jgi:hypothetical protein
MLVEHIDNANGTHLLRRFTARSRNLQTCS